LVLRGFQSGAPGRLLAKAEEAADLVAKFG
jgi:hypothetical protein